MAKTAAKKKPNKEKEKAPPPPDYTRFPSLKTDKFTSLVRHRHRLNESIKVQKKTLAELDSRLMPLMYQAKALAVTVDDLPVVVVESSYTTFDKNAMMHFLLKKKVDPKIVKEALAAASKKKTRAPYVKTGVSGGRPKTQESEETDG